MRKRFSKADDPALLAFLEHATSNIGGYYKHKSGRRVEFIRPLGNVMMRVKDTKTGQNFNANYCDLEALNEMEVIALQLSDETPDILKIESGPEKHD